MKYRLHGVNSKSVIAAVGVWDPLTYNHLNLINFILKRSNYLKCNSCIVIIYPKPSYFLFKNTNSIYLSDIKFIINKILSIGITSILEVTFESKSDVLKNATHFIPAILKHIRLKELYMSPTQSFGQGEDGNQKTISKLAIKYSFKSKIIPQSVFHFKPKRINANQKLIQLLNGGFSFNKQIMPFPPTYFIINKNEIPLPYKNGKYVIGLKKCLDSKITKTLSVKLRNNKIVLDPSLKDKYHWMVIVRGPP